MDIALPSDVANQVKTCKVRKLLECTQLKRVQRCNGVHAVLAASFDGAGDRLATYHLPRKIATGAKLLTSFLTRLTF